MVDQIDEERRNAKASGDHAGVWGQDMATRCKESGVLYEAARLPRR